MNVLLIYPKFPDTFWSFTCALEYANYIFTKSGGIRIACRNEVITGKIATDFHIRRKRPEPMTLSNV